MKRFSNIAFPNVYVDNVIGLQYQLFFIPLKI